MSCIAVCRAQAPSRAPSNNGVPYAVPAPRIPGQRAALVKGCRCVRKYAVKRTTSPCVECVNRCKDSTHTSYHGTSWHDLKLRTGMPELPDKVESERCECLHGMLSVAEGLVA